MGCARTYHFVAPALKWLIDSSLVVSDMKSVRAKIPKVLLICAVSLSLFLSSGVMVSVSASEPNTLCLGKLVINPAVKLPGTPGCTQQPGLGPLLTPIGRDPQFGWSSSSANGYYGIYSEQVADPYILKSTPQNTGIAMAFTDNYHNSTAGVWYLIGIGNNLCRGSICSSCTSPPVIWAEYLLYGSTQYGEAPIYCASYYGGYDLSIALNTNGCWQYYIGTTWYISECSPVGNAINSNGEINMIENGCTPNPTCAPSLNGIAPPYTTNLFYYALQYTTTKVTGLNGGGATWTNPTAYSQYNNGNQWATANWSTSITKYHSGSLTYYYVSYTWT